MNKHKLLTWDEMREALGQIATADTCAEFDQALASGRKITALQLLQRHGLSPHADEAGEHREG